MADPSACVPAPVQDEPGPVAPNARVPQDGASAPGEGADTNLPGDHPPGASSAAAPEASVAVEPPPQDAAGPATDPLVASPEVAAVPIAVAIPSAKDVHDLDGAALRLAVDPPAIRSRMRGAVEAMEALLDRAGGPGLLFDRDRSHEDDRAIRVEAINAAVPLWIIGDLHGDLLALEAALAVIAKEAVDSPESRPRIIFLGDIFDDEGFGLEVLLRMFELILESPERIAVIAGNHDEALSYDGVRFGSNVSPSDFSELLNAHLAHEWMERAGKVAVRLFAQAPRALFLPGGLLVSHGGFPLADLHAGLAETGDWNHPACLADFVWTRAHPSARKKLPNRYSRGSQYGYEDFAAFCELSVRLGRTVTHMVRGHDHVEERFAIYPAYKTHPVLTTVALSRRLPRETIGPRERVPTLARVIEGSLPQVYRMHLPSDLIHELYPEPLREELTEQPDGEALA